MKHTLAKSLFILLSFFTGNGQSIEDYKLWLRYHPIEKPELLDLYLNLTEHVYFSSDSKLLKNAKSEFSNALPQLIGNNAKFDTSFSRNTKLLVTVYEQLPEEIKSKLKTKIGLIKEEGFIIQTVDYNNSSLTILTAKQEVGILYGTFRFLSFMQMHKKIVDFNIVDSPKIQLRMLNHWDNLDRSVERGYAGFSLWNWQKLPEHIDQRYIDYARANASIGINATVLTNVNANALVLTPRYLQKVAALANIFREYGIKVYLTARFSAPMEIGNLNTADPKDENVEKWWAQKAMEIYDLIPNFGGFLVKANSEGQPGPQNYGRNHVDGANMMATVLKPFGGHVIWRAFVYSEHNNIDRAKQAYDEFLPYDGKFDDNVVVQVKNGPIDFQPREPFHPLFGAMKNTSLAMEFQITQEYLGFSSHLVYLPKLFEEVLDTDTFVEGKGSTIAKVIDGSLYQNKISVMAGVSNIGNDLNWTGHPFAQANWYGFGRLAWNPYLTSEQIADEWLRLTFNNESEFIAPVKEMMLTSREAVVNYMNPLGLHHIFDSGHHYGPGPWVDNLGRADWNPVYYHRADNNGIGYNRTSLGSKATSQYAPILKKLYDSPKTIPEEYLLWFHHLPWDYTLQDGTTLWDGIALRYQKGVNQVYQMLRTWQSVQPYITKAQYEDVNMLLQIQLKEAKWWRDACLLYFQSHSNLPLPKEVEKPENTLEYYKSLKFPFAPGIRPNWN
ncbi:MULTISPECIES: alpha-glucuronidase family glycosyl hydrolase [unclassified Maribacter]|uniref:alpha-glucuronidase family glycosyl hydrolase n=1 Tax=unclassified Maribacter TaxID=2615042 RepID=UPI00257FDEE8|nr:MULTISPECIES: alpha-glucuronidase family glycosyl hydrolase [unclassified Maribacter]|tara:strand:- start:23520 stop:25694 length:2175 start_codon:yes stop_codon:yes gene_type:complete